MRIKVRGMQVSSQNINISVQTVRLLMIAEELRQQYSKIPNVAKIQSENGLAGVQPKLAQSEKQMQVVLQYDYVTR